MTDSVRDLAALLSRVERLERQLATPQLQHSSLEDAAMVEKDAAGHPVSQWGKQWDGTHGVAVLGGPVPPIPTTPTVEPAPGGLTVGWDGAFTGDEIAPMDFARVEIHASDVAGFQPNRSTVLVTFETPQGGRAFLSLPATLHHVRLLTRAESGKASPSTPAVMGTPSPAADVDVDEIIDEIISRIPTSSGTTITYATGDPTDPGEHDGDTWYRVTFDDGTLIEGSWHWDGTISEWVEQKLSAETIDSVTAGQITTGYLSAGVQVAAGDPTGARTELDGNGLRHYDTTGTQDVNLSTSGAVFSGRVVGADIVGSAFRTAQTGNRIEIDSHIAGEGDLWHSAGAIRFFPVEGSGASARNGSILSGDRYGRHVLILNGPHEVHPLGFDFSAAKINLFDDQAVEIDSSRFMLSGSSGDTSSIDLKGLLRERAEYFDRVSVIPAGGTAKWELVQVPIHAVSSTTARSSLLVHIKKVYAAIPTFLYPILVWRRDLPGINKFEYTPDGSNWFPLAPTAPPKTFVGKHAMGAGSAIANGGAFWAGGRVDFPERAPNTNYTTQLTLSTSPAGTANMVPRALLQDRDGFTIYLFNCGVNAAAWTGTVRIDWTVSW